MENALSAARIMPVFACTRAMKRGGGRIRPVSPFALALQHRAPKPAIAYERSRRVCAPHPFVSR